MIYEYNFKNLIERHLLGALETFMYNYWYPTYVVPFSVKKEYGTVFHWQCPPFRMDFQTYYLPVYLKDVLTSTIVKISNLSA